MRSRDWRIGLWRRKIDGQRLNVLDRHEGLVKKIEQFFLPGLPKNDPVSGKLALQTFECLDFACIRKQRDVALHTAAAMGNPVWYEIGFTGVAGSLLGVAKDQRPQVIAELPRCERFLTMCCGDVSANGVPLVPVDTAFPLFKIDRITWKIPVNQAMTPRVEIQALLAN